MSTFTALSLLLCLIIVIFTIIPVLRSRGQDGVRGQSETNLRLLRDQIREIEEDRLLGNLSDDQFQVAKREIESRVLEEVSSERDSVGVNSLAARVAGLVLILLVPVGAFTLYQVIGSEEGQDVEAFLATQNQEFGNEELEELANKVIQHIEENPNDAEAWGMLGRTYKAMHQFVESANAWERAYQIAPQDPAILVDYAEARGLARQGDLSGEPIDLIERALRIDPDHGKGLALGGTAAFASGNYQLAIDRWTKLMKANITDVQLVETLKSGIAEAKVRLVDSGQSSSSGSIDASQQLDQAVTDIVSGVITIGSQIEQYISADDTVFIFIKAIDGPPMPVAALRVPVSLIPYEFSMDDTHSLMAGRKLSDLEDFTIGARISKSGNAIRASGDLESKTIELKPGGRVELIIDSRVP